MLSAGKENVMVGSVILQSQNFQVYGQLRHQKYLP